jgi:polysaccharide biosynthesis/export protein
MKARQRRLFVVAAMLVAPFVWAEDPSAPPPEEPPLELVAHPADASELPHPETLGLRRSDYKIGRQDLLEVEVFGVDELKKTVRVADDGSITMPLLGRLAVAGLTKTELEKLVAGLLADRYVRDPQVTVFVKEFESKKVAVSGAVKKPGTYEMLGAKTLLEMISMAGGLDADLGKEIVIFRPEEDGGTTRRMSVDLQRLVYDADPALNLIVDPGDIIYVPAVEKVRIFVGGAVKNPSVYEVPKDEPVTVLKAVTIAGGTTDRAAEKKIQILRTDPSGHRVTLLVDLRKVKRGKAEDPILRPDDIVLVPEAFF